VNRFRYGREELPTKVGVVIPEKEGRRKNYLRGKTVPLENIVSFLYRDETPEKNVASTGSSRKGGVWPHSKVGSQLHQRPPPEKEKYLHLIEWKGAHCRREEKNVIFPSGGSILYFRHKDGVREILLIRRGPY